VHRRRLFAQHLPSFVWMLIVLTLHADYFKDTFDLNMDKLLPKEQRIEKWHGG
jgi:hypothetical protein